MNSILLIEDDPKVGRFISRALADEGFSVTHEKSAAGGRAALAASSFALILLDWMLPDTDGVALARELRNAGVSQPILMLTARSEVKDRVLGLESGADDYLPKPFEIDELLARIRALLRRANWQTRVSVGPLEIDRVAHKATIDGATMTLTVREYTLLAFLVANLDKVVSRGDLLQHVWGSSFDPNSNLVEVHVSRLREKLGTHSAMIETVRGAGYRFRSSS